MFIYYFHNLIGGKAVYEDAVVSHQLIKQYALGWVDNLGCYKINSMDFIREHA